MMFIRILNSGLEPSDFFCGEKLVTSEPANENLTASKLCAAEEDTSALLYQKSLYSEIFGVSKTSKTVLVVWCFLAVVSVISLILSERAANIGVLLLVFVQPMLVFYFVYWRSRRQFASLDYVIKMFVCGFFFATLQSICLEMVLQFAILLFMSVLMAFVGSTVPFSVLSPQFMAPITPNSITQILLSLSTSAESTDSTSNQNDPSKKTYFVWVVFIFAVISCFLNSFVVAAGVEETMKYFVVKCCAFPRELREPDTVLVYLMMASLGFATSENIEYVFNLKESPIPHTSLVVGEIFVLFIRVLMPIHLICSVLQASNLTKVCSTQ